MDIREVIEEKLKDGEVDAAYRIAFHYLLGYAEGSDSDMLPVFTALNKIIADSK